MNSENWLCVVVDILKGWQATDLNGIHTDIADTFRPDVDPHCRRKSPEVRTL